MLLVSNVDLAVTGGSTCVRQTSAKPHCVTVSVCVCVCSANHDHTCDFHFLLTGFLHARSSNDTAAAPLMSKR